MTDKLQVPTRIWVPALAFTALLIAFLVVIFFTNPTLTGDQKTIVGYLYPLLAGFSMSFVSGTALLAVNFPTNDGGKFAFSATAGVAIFAFCFFFPLSFIEDNLNWTAAEKSIDRLQTEVQKTEGLYENMFQLQGGARSAAAEDVLERCSKLGMQLLSISGDQRETFRIQRFQYAASALYKAAAAALLADPSDENRARSLSGGAIDAANVALSDLERLSDWASSGEGIAVTKFQWMLRDQAKERIQYYLAVALAINSKANGNHAAKEAIEVLHEIPQSYRRRYQPETNLFLAWAMAQGEAQQLIASE